VRCVLGLLSVLLLAACTDGGLAPVPNDQARAAFAPGGITNQIEVTAIDRLPLRGAELVAPDGHTTPASAISAHPAPASTFSAEGASSSYAAAGFAVNSIGSNALMPNVVGTAPQVRTRLLAIVSTASIQLPDPAAYRRDWQNYRIRLLLGTPPQIETREIAAPPPLPPAG
jgi:hypothetical protein